MTDLVVARNRGHSSRAGPNQGGDDHEQAVPLLGSRDRDHRIVGMRRFSSIGGKKMTYEDAYTKCRQENAGKVQAEMANSVSRYTVMGGCMKKYGYRLKK